MFAKQLAEERKKNLLALSIVEENTAAKCTIGRYEQSGKVFAVIYDGVSAKPAAHYRFRCAEDRERFISEHVSSRLRRIAAKEKAKQERESFRHTLKVGDILDAMWGYEQTNVDFYEVVKATEKTVDVRKIAKTSRETMFMQGNSLPVAGKFIGEVLKSRHVRPGNYISINSYTVASPWDGREMSWTAYA